MGAAPLVTAHPRHQPGLEVNAMISVLSPAPAVKPDRKQLQPVSVSAYFVGGATRQDIIHGAAVLSITDQGCGEEAAYWCEALYLEDKCVGFRLRKFGSAEVYDLPRSLDSCTCA